jgi:hypothetical protein
MSAFVCERCFNEKNYVPVKHPSDRMKVSIDVMTADGTKRVARVHVQDLCRSHASDLVADARAHPKDYLA